MTHRIRVGIYFNARPEQGGLYHYALTLIDCLARHINQFDFTLYHATLDEPPFRIDSPAWKIVTLPKPAVRYRMVIEYSLMSLARIGLQIPFQVIPEFSEIKQDPPDVMIYVKPTIHVFQWKYRAIFPIHDLQHRLQPEFPEVSTNGEFQRREYMYRQSVRKAAAILTDSQTGREDAIDCYGAEEARVFPLPYIAPTFRKEETSPKQLEKIKEKYSLPDNYFFYPAAFWKHKNHLRIIRALHRIAREHHAHIPLVLAGGRSREYNNVAALVASLGLTETVCFIGYVPDDDLAALYRQALGLIMPTFFGPTNIPILEAWAAECPVITSDLRGIREQVGDAGLLVNPRDEADIADAMWRLDQDADLRRVLINRGKARASQWTPQLFAAGLAEVIHFASDSSPA